MGFDVDLKVCVDLRLAKPAFGSVELCSGSRTLNGVGVDRRVTWESFDAVLKGLDPQGWPISTRSVRTVEGSGSNLGGR